MTQKEPTPALHLEQAMVENTRLDSPETRLKVYQELLFSELLLALSDTQDDSSSRSSDSSSTEESSPQQLNIAILANPQGLKFAAVFTSPQAVRRWRPQGGQYATMRGQDIFKLLEPSPAEVIVVNPGSAPLIALPKAEFRQLASGIVPKASRSPVQVPEGSPNAQTPEAQNSMQISFPSNVFNEEQKQHAQNILMEHAQIEAAAIGAIQPPNAPNQDNWIRTVFLRLHDLKPDQEGLKTFCHDIRNQIKENNELFVECQFEVGIMPIQNFGNHCTKIKSFFLIKIKRPTMLPLINSAYERIEHFQYAFSILKKNLKENAAFQKSFLHLLDALIKIERTSQTSKHIFFIAVGKSAGVARIAASMFVSVGLPVQFVHPTEAFHGDLGIVNSEDIVIFISNNGNSPELLQLIPGLIERRVFIYSITAKPESPLGIKSDLILQLPDVEEKCPLYQSPITSTLTSLALCQLLVAASVESRNFTLENYAKNHPGGAIGKRIFLKVDDLMSKGDNLPIIAPHESFQKVVSVFTTFAKASLLVVENEKYLGLIAERDLRKAMENFGPEVFQKTAKDMMNTNSVIVRPGILAMDALNIMTQKKPFFNVLPVVGEQGTAIGLLQLQDLLTAGLCHPPA